MRSETVAERMHRDGFGNACDCYRPLDGPLKSIFIQMVASNRTRLGIHGKVICRKEPEPSPTASDLRILSLKRIGNGNPGIVLPTIQFPQSSRLQQLLS